MEPKFIVVFLTFWGMVNCQCDSDSGWYGSDDLGVCYSLGKMTSGETPLVEDVFEAEPYCDSFGARLATIRTQAQQDFIRASLVGTRIQYVWTSGNDLAHEGTFEWGYDTGDLVVFTAWMPDEPQGDDISDCIVLRNTASDLELGQSFLWMLFPCEDAIIEDYCDGEIEMYPLCEYTP